MALTNDGAIIIRLEVFGNQQYGEVSLPMMGVEGRGGVNADGAVEMASMIGEGYGNNEANLILPGLSVYGEAFSQVGDGEVELEMLEVVGYGAGTSNIILPFLKVDSTAVHNPVGNAAITVNLLVAGVGVVNEKGDGAVVLPLLSSSATGWVDPLTEGTISLSPLRVHAIGGEAMIGNGAITLWLPEVSGTGWWQGNVDGDVEFPFLEIYSSGLVDEEFDELILRHFRFKPVSAFIIGEGAISMSMEVDSTSGSVGDIELPLMEVVASD